MTARSIFSGCAQSKRSKVLKEPRQAKRVRRARLTAARARSSRSRSCSTVSVGPTRLLWTWERKAASASWRTRKPRRRSRSERSSVWSLIVGLQVVGDDIGVVEVVGEHQFDGHGSFAIFATLLAGNGERADIGEAACVDVSGGGGEHVIAVE